MRCGVWVGHMPARRRGVPEGVVSVLIFLHKRQARQDEACGMGGGDVRRLESVHMHDWRRASLNRAGLSRTKKFPIRERSEYTGREKGGRNRTCSSMSSSTRASTALSSSARLRDAHGYGASVSTRYVRQFSTNTGRSHAMVGAACRRRAASFSPAAATHILTAGSTSASSARSIVALSSALPISPSPSATASASASAVCRARIARRSCACVRSDWGGVRDGSAWSREVRESARPCAAMASKKTVYDAAVVL